MTQDEREKLAPCPFCGSASIDPAGWASTDRSGPACDDCGGSADTVELWNSRPAQRTPSEALREAARDCKKAARELQQGNSKRAIAEVLYGIASNLEAAALTALSSTDGGGK